VLYIHPGGRVAYVAKLDDDPEGRVCLDRLKKFGVSAENIEIVKGGKTPVAYALITRINFFSFPGRVLRHIP
jgi:sugar/nucleoside kinase (ribokinase family)